MSLKTDLYQRWREIAEAAQRERDQTESRYHPEAYHAAKMIAEVYREACRLLSSDDGLDHVTTVLREQMSGTEGYKALLLADLINGLETALEGDDEAKAVGR